MFSLSNPIIHTANLLWHRSFNAKLGLISAGAAFFCFLAIFPAAAAVIAIWGFASDPEVIRGDAATGRETTPKGLIFRAEFPPRWMGAPPLLCADPDYTCLWKAYWRIVMTLGKYCRALCIAALAGATALAPVAASACTSFILKAENGDIVYGRTLEFALQLQSQLVIVPRNLAIKAVGPDGTAGSGLAYTTKYGATGANGLGLPIIVDGINEKGLAAGMLFFPGLAEFQDVAAEDAANSIASYEIVTYILTQFATIQEVKDGLPKIKVNRAPQAAFKMAVPVHVTVHDAAGNSLVVEYVGGALQITDNPTSVLTNAPEISWHLGNLAQTANATAEPVDGFKINGTNFAPWSTGSGMNGLPGDLSSSSRFVRAAFFAANAPAFKDGDEGMGIAFHILNQFDIPPGSVRTAAGGSAGGGVAGYEVTEWISSSDLKNGIYQIKTYGNSAIRQVSLQSADLDAKEVRFIPLDQPPVVTDLSR